MNVWARWLTCGTCSKSHELCKLLSKCLHAGGDEGFAEGGGGLVLGVPTLDAAAFQKN